MPRTRTPTTVQPFVDTIAGPMPVPVTTTPTVDAEPDAARDAGVEVVGPVRRRTLDTVLVAAGAVVTVVLVVAGGLLTWGSWFADDHVGRELSAQHIMFPDPAALEAEGRADLLDHAGEQVTTGAEAEAYASYIAGHLDGVADGATYADLGTAQRDADADLQTAIDDAAPPATIEELQAEADALRTERESLFEGETLRGLLLSTYAWSTIGTIAGIAAVVAFAAAGVMAVLVVLGLIHRRVMI